MKYSELGYSNLVVVSTTQSNSAKRDASCTPGFPSTQTATLGLQLRTMPGCIQLRGEGFGPK